MNLEGVGGRWEGEKETLHFECPNLDKTPPVSVWEV